MVEGNAPHLVSEWIAGFHREHPHVQYDLWNGNSDDVTQRVTRGLSELALIMAPYSTEWLEALPVYEEPWVAIMSPEHPLAQLPGDSLPLEALAGCDMLLPSRQSRQEEILHRFSHAGKTPRVLCRISNTINAFELAEHNVGVAIYPASQGNVPMVGRGSNPGAVVIKTLDDPDFRARYVLVRARNRPLSRVAGEFATYVRELLCDETNEKRSFR